MLRARGAKQRGKSLAGRHAAVLVGGSHMLPPPRSSPRGASSSPTRNGGEGDGVDVVPLPQKKKVILASTRRAGGGADARPPDQENTSSSTRSEPPSLPLEWEMKVSSTSGKTYYRHILSGKTRWTRPEGVASFSEMSWGEGAASFSADNPLARKREPRQSVSSSSEVSMNTATFDVSNPLRRSRRSRSRGRRGEWGSSAVPPADVSAFEQENPLPRQARAGGARRVGGAAAADVTSPHELVEVESGWVEFKSRSSGRVYWRKGSETRWDAPTAAGVPPVGDHSSFVSGINPLHVKRGGGGGTVAKTCASAAVALPGGVVRDGGGEDGAAPALQPAAPEEWTAFTSRTTGRRYWRNKAGETKWTDPSVAV